MTNTAAGALAGVDFGRLDAETDTNLLNYFITVGTAAETLRGKHLVLGRKGAGKSALFKYVAGNAPGTVVQLDLKQYVFQAHRGLRDDGVPTAFAYTESWRFAYVIAMFVEGRRHMPFRLRFRGGRILRKLGAGPDRGPLLAILNWFSRVSDVKLPSITGVADLGGFSLEGRQSKPFQASTRDLIDGLQGILVQAVAKRPITVLVDRLDDAWDGSHDSLELIIGATRAARQLSEEIKQDGAAPAIVFLRSDLWDRCEFNDKNKFGQDTVTLDWSNDDLARVVDERIHKTAGVPTNQGWSEIFTTLKMRQGMSAQSYMLKRCLGRPRDVVAFAIKALEVARSHNNERIERDDVYEAETAYSAHIVLELRDEISQHVSDMESVINALKRLGRRKFEFSTWGPIALSAGVPQAEVDKALDKLFDAGAIGVLRANNYVEYRYRDRELKIEETGWLSVHPAMLKDLSLTDN